MYSVPTVPFDHHHVQADRDEGLSLLGAARLRILLGQRDDHFTVRFSHIESELKVDPAESVVRLDGTCGLKQKVAEKF